MNPVARWWRKRRVDQDLDVEMHSHLEERVDELCDQGHSAQEAQRLARLHFGNLTLQKEDSRSAWGWNLVEQVLQDARYGCRVLLKTPGFTVAAILVLALGIGMNTAMFSAVKAVLLSTLPYPQPERMVQLWQTNKNGGTINVSGPDFRDWRSQNRSFESMATFQNGEATIAGDFAARRVRMAPVGAGFFEVFETHAVVGRTFAKDDQKPGSTPTALLSFEIANQIFGDAASSVGKAVRLNGMSFSVIGVMPPKFDFPDRAQIWLPNDFFPDESARSAHNYRVMGRLRPGVTLARAQADMNVVAARLAREYVDDKDRGIRLVPLFEQLVGSVRPTLLVLSGAVAVVLLIACVNISNLQLARAAARQKELGLRSALGAGRWRLIRQLLTESLLLSAAGGLSGLLVAAVGVRLLHGFAPTNIPRMEGVAIDPAVLCFTAVSSICAGMFFGVLPAFANTDAEQNSALKQGAGKGGGLGYKRWGSALVVTQIGLAVILLSSAGLLIRSYWKLATVATGISSSGVLVANLTWPASTDGNSVDAQYVRQAGSQMLREIGSLPGVKSTAMINGLPFESAPDGGFEIEGKALPADPHQIPDADYRMATRDYFAVFRVPILKGRGFTAEDERAEGQVAIVNQAFEKEFFPDGEALGKRIRFLGFDRTPQFMTIVGVVPDVRSLGPKRPVAAEVFANYFQHADTRMDISLVVRGPANVQAKAKQIVTRLNRDTAVDFEWMDDFMSGTFARERFQTTLLGLFAAFALLLAVMGVYGLLAYNVARRTSELGVRMALGAGQSRILRLVLAQGGILVAIGLALGLVGAIAATRVMGAMLFQVSPGDPATLFGVLAGFAAAALLGCLLPARRAAKIDPMVALRID
jgi:predicted permease